MATVRKFCCNDLLRFSSVNLDYLALTTELSFYLTCLAKSTCYFFLVAVAPRNRIIGYVIGKAEKESKEENPEEEEDPPEEEEEEDSADESEDEHWKGLAVTVNVAFEYRRQGYGMRLIRLLEQLLVDKMLLSPRDCEYYTFVYVDSENTPAKKMFEQCGYEVNKITKDFYLNDKDEEIDSYEMRKELSEEEPSLLQWSGYSQEEC